MKKIISILLMSISLVTTVPISVNAEWKKNGKPSDTLSQSEWRYKDGKSYIQKGWKKIDGKWYHFDNGCMSIGWIYEDQKNYFCDKKTGVMATGWKKINGFWYYFLSDGSMAYNTTIDGCKLGKTGAWIKNNAVDSEIIGVWYKKDDKSNKLEITETTINNDPYFILSTDQGREVEIQYKDGSASVYSMFTSNDKMTLMLYNQFRGWHSGGMIEYVKEK